MFLIISSNGNWAIPYCKAIYNKNMEQNTFPQGISAESRRESKAGDEFYIKCEIFRWILDGWI